MDIQAITNTEKLAKFLMFVSEEYYGTPISRIKLQKGLYFLYAFWIKELSELRNSKSELSDQLDGLSNNLFDSEFVAWAYGPVDRQIYNSHRDNKLAPFSKEEAEDYLLELKDASELVSSFVYNYSRRILNTSDFALVDLSHRDSGWIENYNAAEQFSSNPISKENILRDYE